MSTYSIAVIWVWWGREREMDKACLSFLLLYHNFSKLNSLLFFSTFPHGIISYPYLHHFIKQLRKSRTEIFSKGGILEILDFSSKTHYLDKLLYNHFPFFSKPKQLVFKPRNMSGARKLFWAVFCSVTYLGNGILYRYILVSDY